MAHFAKIGLNSEVIAVLSVHNDVLKDANGVEREVLGLDFLTKLTGWAIWKQTSYNNKIRKNFAGIGHYYDKVRDAFISLQPFPSWALDEEACQWVPPMPYPEDGKKYMWVEETISWDVVNG